MKKRQHQPRRDERNAPRRFDGWLAGATAEQAAEWEKRKSAPQAPTRVRLSRAKGWRMPPGTVKVDRTTVFGNPFAVSKDLDAKGSVRLFSRFMGLSQNKIMSACFDADGEPNPMGGLQMIIRRQVIRKRLPELHGKNLACWCALDQPCHADVLLRLANPGTTTDDQPQQEQR